jgi:hypothetical protein
VRKLCAIFVLLSFFALGSGALEYLHNLNHAHDDARTAHTSDEVPFHSESNCFIHAKLHLPTVAVGWVPLLVFLGIFVAFVTELAPALVSQRALIRIDCRGPPAC